MKQSIIDLLSPVKEDHFIWHVLSAVLAPHVDVLRHPQSLAPADPAAIKVQTVPEWFNGVARKYPPPHRKKSWKLRKN